MHAGSCICACLCSLIQFVQAAVRCGQCEHTRSRALTIQIVDVMNPQLFGLRFCIISFSDSLGVCFFLPPWYPRDALAVVVSGRQGPCAANPATQRILASRENLQEQNAGSRLPTVMKLYGFKVSRLTTLTKGHLAGLLATCVQRESSGVVVIHCSDSPVCLLANHVVGMRTSTATAAMSLWANSCQHMCCAGAF